MAYNENPGNLVIFQMRCITTTTTAIKVKHDSLKLNFFYFTYSFYIFFYHINVEFFLRFCRPSQRRNLFIS